MGIFRSHLTDDYREELKSKQVFSASNKHASCLACLLSYMPPTCLSPSLACDEHNQTPAAPLKVFYRLLDVSVTSCQM